MRTFLSIIGILWAAIGAGNMLLTNATSEGGLAFVIIFNMVLFVLPGLILLGVSWPRPEHHDAP